MTKAERDALKIRVIALAQHIGQRAAARECDLNEDTVRTWCFRERKKYPNLRFDNASNGGTHLPVEPTETNVRDAYERIIRQHSDKSRLALAYTGTKSSEEFANMAATELVKRDTAIAFDATSRALDRTHGWSIAAQQAPNVNVAVQVNVPTPQEREEMRNLDAKLDQFAKLLKAKSAE